MEFDKNHKVKHWLLEDKEEAQAFIDFLETEKLRHIKENHSSGWMVKALKYGVDAYDRATVELWKSQAIRHNEDIEAIDISIAEVKQRLGL